MTWCRGVKLASGLRRAAALLLLATVGVAGWRAARGADASPSPFIGTWISSAESKLTAMCGGTPLIERLGDTTLVIRAGAESDLVLEIGCRCHLPLTVSASDPHLATLSAATPCPFIFNRFDISAMTEALDLRLDPQRGTLALDLQAGQTRAAPLLDCASSSIVASLSAPARAPAPAATDCGPDDSAVGVLPYAIKGGADCPFGAGHEGLEIVTHDEDDLHCRSETGALGEGAWALPQAYKYEPDCQPRAQGQEGRGTALQLCRVDGRLFKPLTTDPTATDQFYAVLKLGNDPAPCPNGGVEMIGRMDSEDDDNHGSSIGPLGPNWVGTQPGNTATELHFCYFRWAETEADTMAAFPVLGFPYAVFHDFDGPQPLWVMLKRWMYSNNEAQTSGNKLTSTAKDPTVVDEFKRNIGMAEHYTYFDLARVR